SSSTSGGEHKAPPKQVKKHDKHEPGPHKGTVFDWGPGLHLELVVNHEKKEARVYVLDEDEQTPRPISSNGLLLSINEPKFQVQLKPEKQPKDSEGKVSCFVGVHDELGKERDFEGSIAGSADGKNWTGDFKEDDDEHGHEHKKK